MIETALYHVVTSMVPHWSDCGMIQGSFCYGRYGIDITSVSFSLEIGVCNDCKVVRNCVYY